MADLNSVLLEGLLMDCKGKKDSSGWWMMIRSKPRVDGSTRGTIFRVDLPTKLHDMIPRPLSQGSRLRVIGRLVNASRIGAYVLADHLEVRTAIGGASV